MKRIVGRDKAGDYTADTIRKREAEAFAETALERELHAISSAFLQGKQWVRFHRDHLEPINLDRYDGEKLEKVVDNQIAPVLDRQASRILTPLTWEVPAHAPDDASRQGAWIAESVVRHTAHEHRWKELDRRLWYQSRLGGCAALVILWDPSKRGFGVDENGDEFGEGDIECFVANISEFAVQPGNHHPAQADWWILRRALPPERVQAMYGLKEKPAADAGMFGSSSVFGTRSSTARFTKTVTLFERPCHGKKGGVWTVVGGKIVDHTDWPFPFTNELNIEVYRPVQQEDKWTGRSGLWDALNDQVLVNLWETYKVAFAEDSTRAPIMVDAAFAEEIPALPGALMPVTPDPDGGFMPQRLAPVKMPEALFLTAQEARERIVTKIGSADVFAGEAPKSRVPAASFAMAVNEANQSMGPQIEERARVWSRVASKVLELYEAKVTSPGPRRTAYEYGPDGRRSSSLRVIDYESQSKELVEGWRGEDFLGHTHAEVPIGAIQPRNSAVAQAVADNLLQYGMIEKGDFRTYYNIAGFGNDPHSLHLVDPDWERAERENHKMVLGRDALVEDIDEHAIHRECHVRFMKSARFEKLPDEMKEIFRRHLAQHETVAAEAAGRAVAQQAVSPALAAATQTAAVDPAVLAAMSGAQSQPGPAAPPSPVTAPGVAEIAPNPSGPGMY